MFSTILIANRGEIACRVAATARRMGIKTIAVYSEADAGAKHVEACDEAVCIGPPAAQESYLRGDRIIEAALAAGAQAIHPGYGFLSENANFARGCVAAGMVFIGPPAAAISAMGSKCAAKALMEAAVVPLLPGYHGDNQDADFLQAQADGIAYPVLLKASAGGGGKGMRIVERRADFPAALASCKREAQNSFGDDKVLVEKYLIRPRHVEIQVFGDAHGNCVYLFERDCSVQRRHQKVAEEAPAPGMPPERRTAMGDAAVAAATAVGYVGAGTVEFLLSQDGSFYFMEMNTRLQVEHPVTEMITGLDLVEWQLRVACGQRLPLNQSQLSINGHAIEARIYAENPERDFLPSIGTVRHLQTPSAVMFERGDDNASHAPAAVRIDSGVRRGDVISPFYDPMIAKLIAWGGTREQALAHMVRALAEYQIVGVTTNIAFLRRLFASGPFAAADLDTGLIERNRGELFPPAGKISSSLLALAAVSLLCSERESYAVAGDPWANGNGWRLNGVLRRRLEFTEESEIYTLTIAYRADGADGWTMELPDRIAAIRLIRQDGFRLTVELDHQVVSGNVVREGDALHIFSGGAHAMLSYIDPLAHAGTTEAQEGKLTAPMPGKIVAILARAGDRMAKGAPLVIMEAMKMEHTIVAPTDGIVEEMLYEVGDQVGEGTQLLSFKAI